MTKSSNSSSNDFMSTPFWSNSVNDIQNFLQRLSAGNIDSSFLLAQSVAGAEVLQWIG
jgi:hypothetical protein